MAQRRMCLGLPSVVGSASLRGSCLANSKGRLGVYQVEVGGLGEGISNGGHSISKGERHETAWLWGELVVRLPSGGGRGNSLL